MLGDIPEQLTNGTEMDLDSSQPSYVQLLPGSLNASSSPLIIDVSTKRQWVLAWWVQLIYALLFGTMVSVATLGNVFVVWIVLAHRSMRTVTNYFLVNLSVADAMTATFNAIFNLVYMLESHWAFGDAYCVFSNFVANLTVASSALTIAAMSIDRYFAIVHPLCGRLTRWQTVATISIIWASSLLLSLPTLLYSSTRSYRYADGSVRTVCMLVWPDGQPYVSYADHVYNVVFLVLTYVVPVTTMIATYTRMSLVLWGSRFIGEFTEHQHKALQSKRKVVKMLSTVVTLFTVSWLPYHLYFLYVFHHPNVAYVDSIQHVYLAMYWLAMSHAMYNPIVYYLMNRRFRHYFRMFLRGSCASTWLETRPSLSITPASRWGTRRGTDKFYPDVARGPDKLQDDSHYLNRKFTVAHGKATNGDVPL